jgi:two-component system, OmpR family, KDP operon response regulator KdpE
MIRVLIVEDDAQILRALRINLVARHYEVLLARSGPEALEVAASVKPDLVILDLGLPGFSGIHVIEGLRGWTEAPILVVSGRTESVDKVNALDAGADDYVTKPFDVNELLARIRALTRRSPSEPDEPVIHFGNIRVDLAEHMVHRMEIDGSGMPVKLTPTEWRILEVLIRNPRRLITKHFLLTTVWGPAYANEDGYLRLYLAQLRRKLEPVPARPRYLVTEPGMGFRFSPDEDRPAPPPVPS